MALKNQVEHYARKFELTEREMEVFYYLVNRNVNPAVLGKKLNISLHTVNNHLKKILEKTHSESKTELLADFLLFLDKQKSGLDLPLLHPRVLILDDESDLTKMLHRFFQSKNMETYTFNDPVLALDSIRKLKIDVVVSDIRMPKIDGVHFLEEIRKLHLYEPGVIFISGYQDDYGVEALFDKGAFAFLEKPLDLERLHRLVWEYVYGSQPHAETSEIPLHISLGNTTLSLRQLGFGGICLQKAQITETNPLPLDLGSRVVLDFNLPHSQEKHNAVCEVVWVRKDSGNYGLKFLEISPETKREVLELVRAHNILSFIPKC